MIGDRDLFGLPIRPGHGQRGRPRHVPTPELRARVIDLREAGAGQAAIAEALGVTIPTLRLHYPAETGTKSRAWQKLAERDAIRKGDDNGR